jgi:hypothetical protein
LADTNYGDEVINGVDSLKRTVDGRGITNVANLQFNLGVQVGGSLALGAVDLRAQIVEHSHAVTVFQ